MEKMNLAKNICKTIYSFRFRTINQRVNSAADEFLAATDEFSKVTADPNIKNILSSSSSREAKHVLEVKQQFDKSVTKLGEHYKQFKEHDTFNMLRTKVEPSVATTLVGALLGAFAYNLHLSNKYQALEKELSAKTADSKLTSIS